MQEGQVALFHTLPPDGFGIFSALQLKSERVQGSKTSCWPGAVYLLNFPSVNHVHVWASQFSLTFGVLVCFRRPHCIGWDLTANLVEGSGKKHDKASSFIWYLIWLCLCFCIWVCVWVSLYALALARVPTYLHWSHFCRFSLIQYQCRKYLFGRTSSLCMSCLVDKFGRCPHTRACKRTRFYLLQTRHASVQIRKAVQICMPFAACRLRKSSMLGGSREKCRLCKSVSYNQLHGGKGMVKSHQHLWVSASHFSYIIDIWDSLGAPA